MSKLMMNRIVTSIIFLVLMGIFASCGIYTFSPRGKSSITSISVNRFGNETQQLGLEDRMTDDIIDAFITDGSMKVVSQENAEAVLVGSLISYERRPHEFTETDEVTAYAVTMGFEVSLKKGDDDSEIWTERFSQLGVYNVGTETEEDAQQKAILLLVEAILNKTTKSW